MKLRSRFLEICIKSLAAILVLSAPAAFAQELGVSAPAMVQSSESDILARLSALEARQGGYVVMEEEEETYPGGFFAGFEAVFAKPYFESGVAIMDISNNTTMSFDPTFSLSPRIYFGFQSEAGSGVQARYWQYDQGLDPIIGQDSAESIVYSSSTITQTSISASDSTFLGPSYSGTLTAFAGVEAKVLDLECYAKHDLGSFQVQTFGGIRYAKLAQDFRAEVVSPQVDGTGFILHSLRFDGLGPTIGADARVPITDKVLITGGPRLSVLYGETRELIEAADITVRNLPPGSSLLPFEVSHDIELRRKSPELLNIIEVRIGVEWREELSNGALVFVTTGVESQFWANAGNLTSDVNSMSFLGLSVGGGVML